jgi:hypothetical protein
MIADISNTGPQRRPRTHHKMEPAEIDAILTENTAKLNNPQTVTLAGSTTLTMEECKIALDEAMKIISCHGTTAVDSNDTYQKAKKWMQLYYPNWA